MVTGKPEIYVECPNCQCALPFVPDLREERNALRVRLEAAEARVTALTEALEQVAYGGNQYGVSCRLCGAMTVDEEEGFPGHEPACVLAPAALARQASPVDHGCEYVGCVLDSQHMEPHRLIDESPCKTCGGSKIMPLPIVGPVPCPDCASPEPSRDEWIAGGGCPCGHFDSDHAINGTCRRCWTECGRIRQASPCATCGGSGVKVRHPIADSGFYYTEPCTDCASPEQEGRDGVVDD